MRGGRFRFAVIQALVLGVVTVVVATFYDLPVRDPDGADVKTYVRLPVILLLAFLIDVAPRALARRPSPADLPRALMAVVRERWTAAQIRFALVGLGVAYPIIVDTTRARTELGWVPRFDSRTALQDMLDAYRRAAPLNRFIV